MTQNTLNNFKGESLNDEILIYLLSVGISYTREIQRNTRGSYEDINSALADLKKAELVELYKITSYPDRVMELRIPEFWSQGIIGMSQFNMYKWWIPTMKAVEFMQKKYEGKGIQIKGALRSFLKEEEQ